MTEERAPAGGAAFTSAATVGGAGQQTERPADSAGQPWAGRELNTGPFAGDDGTAEPALAAAVETYRRGEADLGSVVDALPGARVLVPVLASGAIRNPGPHGVWTDLEATAAVVALEAPDGRRALPVFTSVATMAAWRPDARPVPVPTERAALSAVEERWDLMVVDPGALGGVTIPRPAVWALAQGVAWRPAVLDGAVTEEVRAAVVAALAGIDAVARVAVVPGTRAEVSVALDLVAGLDRAALGVLTTTVNEHLAASELIAERVDSIELRLRSAG